MGLVTGRKESILENCRAILEEAGLSLKDGVKTLVFMTGLSEFSAMNEVYASYFPENPSARSCVQGRGLTVRREN